MSFRTQVVMGDPQAPFAAVLEVLERARLLNEHGLLRDDVQLVSIGDHFDWGPVSVRERATNDALTLLSWLSTHPAEQVVMVLGNHDLARVCELAPFADDDAFIKARARADAAYRGGDVDQAAETALLAELPFIADAESLARDFSCFSMEQRRAVELLLRSGRFRLAHAHDALLVVHAGITVDDLSALGIEARSAAETAQALNAWLDERVAAWGDGALDLEPLHQAGSASRGWGRGAFFHRPADPAHGREEDFVGPPRRRFDPRRLPAGFAQVIGHIRDKKCRELMPDWCEPTAAGDGALRSLRVRGDAIEYVAGCLDDARLFFVDAGMLQAPPGRYQLFDLNRRQAL